MAPLLLLLGCGPTFLLDDGVTDLPTLDAVLVGIDPAIGLDTATLSVGALLMDRCADLVLLPVDRELELVGASGPPLALLPGGYCALHLLLDEPGPNVRLGGVIDGALWTETLHLAAISVLEPFAVGAESLLFAIPADELQSGRSPVVAEIYVDVDGDGRVSDGDLIPR